MEHETSTRGIRPATLEVVETQHLRRSDTPNPQPESAPAKPGGFRDPLIGKLLNERYRVARRIGKGGMGIVYLAEHELIRRKVAIKTLQASVFATDELVERFKREAMAAAAIGNEHIVDVLDMGQLEDGAHYLVLEYLDGVELAAAVAAEGYMSIGRAVRIAMQLCDALTAVHAAGIVHRDLKPENVFLIQRSGASDFVKVLDFGVCKVREAHDGKDQRLTETGAALGTPQFMAPEQIEGRSDVDARADIYAVGGILFHALTGADPFEAPSLPRLFMRICDEPPPHLCVVRPEVPEALAAVVARALAKRPEDRWRSGADLKAALASFQAFDADSVTSALHAGALPANVPAMHDTELPTVVVPGQRRWPARAAIGLGLLFGAAMLWQLAFAEATSGPGRGHPITSAKTRKQPAYAATTASKEAAGAYTGVVIPPSVPSAPVLGPRAGDAKRSSAVRAQHHVAPAVQAEPAGKAVDPGATAAPPAAPEPSVDTTQRSAQASAASEPEPLLPPRELKHVF